MSEVPLGVFLSGGLDSSAVAALMTKIRRAPIETFSVGYDESSYSELPFARTVAEHIGSVHHEVRVNQKQFFEALPKLIWHEDEPLAWPSSVSLYYVARLARERVTVVLTGEGSDETLAGYTRYAWTAWNTRLDRAYRRLTPAKLRQLLCEAIATSPRLGADLRRKLQHTFLGKDGDSWVSLYLDNFYCAFPRSQQTELLADELRGPSDAAYRNSLAYWDRSSGDLIARLLYTDIKTYLVELCMKQDNMSMAASIESRVPFLDHLLVEFAASIPSKYKIKGLTGKQILKSAVKGLLPAPIVHRHKMGFPTPFRGWLVGQQLDTIEGLLHSTRSLARGLFKPESVKRLFAEYRAGAVDHCDRLWRLLNLEIWQRVFLDGERELPEPSATEHSLRPARA